MKWISLQASSVSFQVLSPADLCSVLLAVPSTLWEKNKDTEEKQMRRYTYNADPLYSVFSATVHYSHIPTSHSFHFLLLLLDDKR